MTKILKFPHIPDDLDWTFLIVTFLIAFLVTCSTTYDYFLRKTKVDKYDPDYYKTPLESSEKNLAFKFKYQKIR